MSDDKAKHPEWPTTLMRSGEIHERLGKQLGVSPGYWLEAARRGDIPCLVIKSPDMKGGHVLFDIVAVEEALRAMAATPTPMDMVPAKRRMRKGAWSTEPSTIDDALKVMGKEVDRIDQRQQDIERQREERNRFVGKITDARTGGGR